MPNETIERNKAAVDRYADEIWNKGNFAIFEEFVTPDCVVHHPMPGSKPGVEGLKAAILAYRTAFPDTKMTILHMVAEGEYVVDHWRMTGTHTGPMMGMPPTGRQVDYEGMKLQRMRDGKIAEFWSLPDALTMLQQLGLAPMPG